MLKIFLAPLIVLFGVSSFSQVAVRNEPHHHNVFENDHIRVLDVFIGPHDTTGFHIHNTPSVFITLTKTATGSQLIGSQPTKGISGVSSPGSSSYDSLAVPRIHRVWNEDSTWFHVMDIELIGSKPRNDQLVLQNPFLTLIFNQPLANGYNLKLAPKHKWQLQASPVGYFLLSTEDALVEYEVNDYVQHRAMKAGHYFWIEPGRFFTITSTGAAPAKFLLLQLK